MIKHLSEPVTLWHEGEIPARLLWKGRRYRVTDRPTPIRQPVDVPALTHPLERLVGFRMQVTDEDDNSVVVDVLGTGADAQLVAIYD